MAAVTRAKIDVDSNNSSSSADHRNSDILASLSNRSEEYRLLFRLPADEVLLQDFNCAIQENILIQGHMYLFVHHICFYSNIFGYETKKTISFNEIICVRKAKTAGIFPNAIEIVVTDGKKHFFGSFLSRDEAYRLIVDGWAEHSNEVKALLERQDSKSETSSQDISTFILERVQTSKALEDDSSLADRIKVVNVLEPSNIGNMEADTVVKPSECESSDPDDQATTISGNPITWTIEDVDAPKIPDQFTLAAEAKFPILVEDFFNLFISDRSVAFLEDFHKRCGDKDFQCTPWQQNGQFGRVRSVSFLHPVKIYLGAKCGQCQETQKFRVYKNSHLRIETSQQVSDVPYADYFHVEGIWDVQQDKNGGNSCTMRVYSNVAFSKKTIFRGKIEQTTKDEYQDVCAIWINSANYLLKKDPVEQFKGVTDQNACTVREVEVHVPSTPEEPPEKSHPAPGFGSVPHDLGKTIVSSNPVAMEAIHGNPTYAVATMSVQTDTNYFSTITSLVTKLWISAVSHFKAQSPLFQASLIFFAVLLLFQVSFIYRVTRVPEIRVVIQDSSSNGISGFNPENIEWLEKRFNYLKDSMVLLEAQMDSMRREYTLLKSHLERLEQLKAKL